MSEKGPSQSIKNIRKHLKLPFKSTSPKPSQIMNKNKSSTTNLKKVSKLKSPNKIKGMTETGPIIKRVGYVLYRKI